MAINYGYLRGSAVLNSSTATVLIPFSNNSNSFYNIADTVVVNSFTITNTTNYINQTFNSPVVAEVGFYTVGNGGSTNYIPLKTNIFLDGNETADILNDKLTVFVGTRLMGASVGGIYIGTTGLRYTNTSNAAAFSAPAYGIRTGYYTGATSISLDYNLNFTDYGIVTATTGTLYDCAIISANWISNTVNLTYGFQNTTYAGNAASIQMLSLFCPILYAPTSWISASDISTYEFGDNPEIIISTTNGPTGNQITSTLYQDIHNDNVIIPVSKNLVFNGPGITAPQGNPADSLTINIASPNTAYTVYNPGTSTGNSYYTAYLSMLINVGS